MHFTFLSSGSPFSSIDETANKKGKLSTYDMTTTKEDFIWSIDPIFYLLINWIGADQFELLKKTRKHFNVIHNR